MLFFFQVVLAILGKQGYSRTAVPGEASLLLLNTCAIRDRAEQKIWSRLGVLRSLAQPDLPAGRAPAPTGLLHPPPGRRPVIGVLGCMAERLKERMLAPGSGVDLVAGPDAYRDLPRLLAALEVGNSACPFHCASLTTDACELGSFIEQLLPGVLMSVRWTSCASCGYPCLGG